MKDEGKTSQGWRWRKKVWRIWETEQYSSPDCGEHSSVLAVSILTHQNPLVEWLSPRLACKLLFFFYCYLNNYWKSTFDDGILGIG